MNILFNIYLLYNAIYNFLKHFYYIMAYFIIYGLINIQT